MTAPKPAEHFIKGTEMEKRGSVSSLESSKRIYAHNIASLSWLLPTLFSILWWHDSPFVVQIFMFVALSIYGLDLVNSRDGVAVGVWIGALVMTMTSGFATLLQVDDADATGGTVFLFLLRLSVEGMLFCSCVSLSSLLFFASKIIFVGAVVVFSHRKHCCIRQPGLLDDASVPLVE
jgi:hypothetical protein